MNPEYFFLILQKVFKIHLIRSLPISITRVFSSSFSLTRTGTSYTGMEFGNVSLRGVDLPFILKAKFFVLITSLSLQRGPCSVPLHAHTRTTKFVFKGRFFIVKEQVLLLVLKLLHVSPSNGFRRNTR